MNAALTTREACARLVEHAGRGHVAHEQVHLNALAATLRKLPEASNPAAAILAAARTCNDIAKHCDGALDRLLMEMRDRIVEEVSTADPMEPYSDRDKWWPRAA